MSNSSLFTQVGMIIVAVAIFFTYIKPTYTQIQTTRDATATYVTEADKVKSVDDMLTEKTAKVDSVSAADTAALKRYMPDTVDDMAVMKDIRSIFTALAIPLGGLTSGATVKLSAGATTASTDNETTNLLAAHSFSVTTGVTYDELKTLLKTLEVNNYLLQVDSLKIMPSPTGVLNVTMVLTAFSRAAALPMADQNGGNPS